MIASGEAFPLSSTVFALPCRVPVCTSVARRVVLTLLFAAGIVLLGWAFGDRAQAAESVVRPVAVTVEPVADAPEALPELASPERVLPQVTVPDAVDAPALTPPVVPETPDVPDALPQIRVTVPRPPIAVDDVVELPSSTLPRKPLPVDAGTGSTEAARPEPTPDVAPTRVRPVRPVDVVVPPTASAPSDTAEPTQVATPAVATTSQLPAAAGRFTHADTTFAAVGDTTDTPRPQGPAHTPALPDSGTTFDVSHRVGNPLLGTLNATPAAASRLVTTSPVGTPTAIAPDRPEEVQVFPA